MIGDALRGLCVAVCVLLAATHARADLRDVAYGPSPKQRMDVYFPPAHAGAAPIVVMLHGGAWMFGDKASRGVVDAKRAHWVAGGAVLVSLNTRLWPEASPLEQADDLAHALASVQAQAASWGGDADRIVLMGHSAGAHLVALLSASPRLAAAAGAKPWRGTVVLDSAALDLEALMQSRHARFYDRVFGSDPAGWRAASPTARLAADGRGAATPMLLVCSTRRSDDSCGQSHRFAARVQAAGGRAEVAEEPFDHGGINTALGTDPDYTARVDAFIATLGIAPPAGH